MAEEALRQLSVRKWHVRSEDLERDPFKLPSLHPLPGCLYMPPAIDASSVKTVVQGRFAPVETLGPMAKTSIIEAKELWFQLMPDCLSTFPSLLVLIFLLHPTQSSFYLKNGSKLGQCLSGCHSAELLLPGQKVKFFGHLLSREKYREIVSQLWFKGFILFNFSGTQGGYRAKIQHNDISSLLILVCTA